LLLLLNWLSWKLLRLKLKKKLHIILQSKKLRVKLRRNKKISLQNKTPMRPPRKEKLRQRLKPRRKSKRRKLKLIRKQRQS
jgi:hypothetical protein